MLKHFLIWVEVGVEAFLNWAKCVESFSNYMNTPENKKVKLITFKLKSGASIRWPITSRPPML